MRWILGLLLAGMLVLVPLRVLAHANYVSSDPPVNAAVPSSPSRVRITFSEAVELRFSEIQVLDSKGGRVDLGNLRVVPGDNTSMTVDLPALPLGLYTIGWKAYSAVDGHTTRGAFTFTVGDTPLSSGDVSDSTGEMNNLPVVETGIRWLNLLSAFIVTGAFGFWAFVLGSLSPSSLTRSMWDAVRKRLLIIAWMAAVVGLVGVMLALVQQAARATDTSILGGFSIDFIVPVMESRFGLVLLARLLVLVGVAGLVAVLAATGEQQGIRVRGLKGNSFWLTGALLGMALQFTTSLNSHSAALNAGAVLAVAVDWLHLCAAAFWIGGLVSLVAALLPSIAGASAQDRSIILGRVVPRFSLLGVISVTVLILTGTILTVEHLPSLRDLIESAYGRALSTKLVLIVPSLLLAAANLLYIRPRLHRLLRRDGTPGDLARQVVSRFRVLVRWETVGAAVVLLVAAMLTSLSPSVRSETSGPLIFDGNAGKYSVQLKISPGRLGQNEFSVELRGPDGVPITDLRSVTLVFTYLDRDLGDSVIEMREPVGDRYAASGRNLSVSGQWQVEAQIQPVGDEPVSAPFRFDVPGSDAPQQPNQNIRNPFPPNASSIAAGRLVFENNCAICHGERGRGDGPLGETLNPRPANLTEHAQSHSDTDLYGWITDGKGLGMPAFGGTLSETERWHVVNFIKRGLSAR